MGADGGGEDGGGEDDGDDEGEEDPDDPLLEVSNVVPPVSRVPRVVPSKRTYGGVWARFHFSVLNTGPAGVDAGGGV